MNKWFNTSWQKAGPNMPKGKTNPLIPVNQNLINANNNVPSGVISFKE